MKKIIKIMLIHSFLIISGFSNQIFAKVETYATSVVVTPATYITDGDLTVSGAENNYYSDDDFEITRKVDVKEVELTDIPVKSKTTYYVDQNYSAANDTNSGTEAQPWLTIPKAANTLIAGDTVFIKTGIYNKQVVPRNSGSQGHYIVYMAYPGDTVTIDGTGLSVFYADGLFDIADNNYIICDGFYFTNSSGSGVRLNGNNLIIKNNKFNSNFKFSAIRTAWSGYVSDVLI